MIICFNACVWKRAEQQKVIIIKRKQIFWPTSAVVLSKQKDEYCILLFLSGNSTLCRGVHLPFHYPLDGGTGSPAANAKGKQYVFFLCHILQHTLLCLPAELTLKCVFVFVFVVFMLLLTCIFISITGTSVETFQVVNSERKLLNWRLFS